MFVWFLIGLLAEPGCTDPPWSTSHQITTGSLSTQDLGALLGVSEELPEFGTLTESMLTLFRCFTDGCTAYDGTPLQDMGKGGKG